MTGAPLDILYVLSNGFAARMVLHSDLLPELERRGLRVAVMAPNAAEDHFRSLCERRGVEPIVAPPVGSRALSHYAQARRYLFEDFEKNAALRSKHQWEWHHSDVHPLLRLRPMLGKLVNSALLRAPAVPGLLHRAEQRLLRSAGMRRILERIRPRLVVATYPVAWLEALAVLEAQRLGIGTVGQLLSWDNITCKGRFAAIPDRFISWGPIMSQELQEFYGAGPSEVLEAGVAHFDLHRRPVDPVVLRGHLAQLGLDPARPYLFFGMSAAYFAPKEADIVAHLADGVRRGAFGRDLQLLVRPHPQNMRGPMADPKIVAKLRAIAGGPVVLDIPEVLSDRVDFAEHDMLRLAALLHGAAVTLNSGSTLSIDALLHDRPVVLTLFDADASLPWYESARRLGEFPHLEKLVSYGGVRVTRSLAELEAAIRSYLEDPGLDAEGRKRALAAECGTADGQACVRIADGLTSFLERRG